MGKKQCVHVYVRAAGPYKKGERCKRVGKEDTTGECRCYRHRYARYVLFHQKRKQAYVTTRIERISRRLQELTGDVEKKAGDKEKTSIMGTLQDLIAKIP